MSRSRRLPERLAREVADLLDEMTQAAESAATAYEHGALGEARERDRYVRALKADLLAKITDPARRCAAP